ncbi:MAG: iron-containing alcohol dehydrogenase [Rhizobiaceae bacterium]|nr:iron-containing alcohol dehydrogenase [Rhizobiaceae bacterium]
MQGFSRSFSFVSPTAVQFGAGIVASLPDCVARLAGNRPLIVGDPGIERAGILARVEAILGGAGLAFTVFTDVESDPDVRSVRRGVEVAKAASCDVVVAIGGGSALDAAKGIALMLSNAGDIVDYVGIDKVTKPTIPLIAIPTTAGTGSELTIWSVLSDRANGAKFGIGSPLLCPSVALLDPELTISLPQAITAATGLDALTHAIESLVCTASNPFSAAPAEMAIRMIGENLRLAVAHGENREARANMLIASALAGIAFNQTRLGYVHAFSMPLGSRFKIPHGLVNAITLPAVMQFNLPGNLDAFARIAGLLGERLEGLTLREAAQRSVQAVMDLKTDIGINQTLADFGVDEDSYDDIIDETMKSGNCPVNPRQATREDFRAMLRAAQG